MKRTAIGLSLGLGTFGVVSWFVGGRLLAASNRSPGPPPEELSVTEISLESKSGSMIKGWYIPHPTATATVVLCHGYQSTRGAMVARARMLHSAGYATVLIDLQAHGESGGEFITVGYLEQHDVRAAVGFARSQNPNHKIAVIGRSLGGAATTLAHDLNLDAVVLESVFPTLKEAIHNRVADRLGVFADIPTWSLIAQFKIRLGFSVDDVRPIDEVSKLNCPTLILAGSADPHTPLVESKRLYEAASEPKQFVNFEGAGHEDLMKFDPKLYEANVVDFLKRSL